MTTNPIKASKVEQIKKAKASEVVSKEQKTDTLEFPPCPTPVLLYVATNYMYHSSIDPWYGKIKELSGGVGFMYSSFQRAAILGMFPELKEACQYFKENLNKHIEKNPILFKRSRNKFVDIAREKLKLPGLKKIEKDTVKLFNLPNFYDINNLSEEQRKNIEANLIKAGDACINEAINKCSSVVQVLGRAIKDDVVYSSKSSICLASSMEILQRRLDAGREKDTKYPFSYPEENEVARQIFELQDKGILDERFNIKDFCAFAASELVKNFSYQGKKINLENKIDITGQSIVMGKGKTDYYI